MPDTPPKMPSAPFSAAAPGAQSDATDATATVTAPSPAVRLTRTLALVSLLALFALCLVWELWLGVPWLAIKALPLVLPLAGLRRFRLYTYRWTSLLVWLYVLEGLTRLRDPAPAGWLALAEVALSLLLFAACVAQIRLRLGPRKRTRRDRDSSQAPTP